MKNTQLIARVRLTAFLEDTHPDFTDLWILNELSDVQQQLYERSIMKSRQGYWLTPKVMTITAGQASYPIPPRSCAGGIERVQIAFDSSQDWVDLDRVFEATAWQYELGTGQTGTPIRYATRGDSIVLFPTPATGAAYALRVLYYIRPSRLALPQTVTNGGLITAVDPVARTVTVSVQPTYYDPDTTTPSNSITSGMDIDIVGKDGWHQTKIVEATETLASLTYTLSGTQDMSTVQKGDVVRAPDQSDWPALPDDFHRSLCDVTAARIGSMRGVPVSSELTDLAAADLSRFGDMITPRVQGSAQAIVAPSSPYRGTRRFFPVRYP